MRKLINTIAKKFFSAYRDQTPGVDFEDLTQQLWLFWLEQSEESEAAVKEYLEFKAKEFLNHCRQALRVQKSLKEGSIGEWSLNSSAQRDKKVERKVHDRYDTFVALQTADDQKLLRWARERISQVVMAERLGVTQPTISTKLKKLKEDLQEFLHD